MSQDRWIVLKLTSLGENTLEHVLRASLNTIFGEDIDVFFPFKSPKEHYNSKISVLDGYIFVKPRLEVNYYELTNTYYFEKLTNDKFSFLSNEKVNELKKKLKEKCEHLFFEYEYVKVIDGPYKDLEGSIIRVNKETVVLDIHLRSRAILVEVPKTCIIRYCP